MNSTPDRPRIEAGSTHIVDTDDAPVTPRPEGPPPGACL